MADIQANRALAAAYISKQLGFRLEELRSKDRALTRPPMASARFKRYKNVIDEKVRASALIAQTAARAVVRSVDRSLPTFTQHVSAAEVRDAILRKHEYVDLDSLLKFCWASGVAVMSVRHLPSQGKRFDGMAVVLGNRPVIVLASGRDGPPWLAFYLAHELGHIMLGHVRRDTGALIDGELTSKTGSSTHEREADQFACEVLTGFPTPGIKDLKVKGPKLAVIAARSGPNQGIDPGVYALIYAKSNNRWPVAQIALKYLNQNSGGQARVFECLQAHFAGGEASEEDKRFLDVLQPTKPPGTQPTKRDEPR